MSERSADEMTPRRLADLFARLEALEQLAKALRPPEPTKRQRHVWLVKEADDAR